MLAQKSWHSRRYPRWRKSKEIAVRLLITPEDEESDAESMKMVASSLNTSR